MDILSGSWPGEIYFFRRKVNGTYAEAEMLKDRAGKKLNIGHASAISLVDWDGDKDLDLFVGNIDGGIYFIPNEGNSTKPAFGTPIQVKSDSQPIKAADGDAGPTVVDWDGDGKLDLLVGSGAGDVLLFKNIGEPGRLKFGSPIKLLSAMVRGFKPANAQRSCTRAKVTVADWNGDGLNDLIVGDFIGGSTADAHEYHGWVWVYLRKPPETASR
jgi:hypothetical protein